MDTLFLIDDALAFVRLKGGVYKQVPVYARGGKVFVPHSGGYVRVCANIGDGWATSAPGVKIVDFTQDVPGLFLTGEPKYVHKSN